MAEVMGKLVWLAGIISVAVMFILTESDFSDIADILEVIFGSIGKFLYTIFVGPFKAIGNFFNKRSENKRKIIEAQIELEKIKKQNWENGII